MEREAAGKKIVVRDRFPAGQFHALHKAVRADDYLGDRSFEDQVGPYIGTVLTWEFPGDPLTIDAWKELDTFEELPAVIRAINGVLSEKLARAVEVSKN